jgi:hypothetical protein
LGEGVKGVKRAPETTSGTQTKPRTGSMPKHANEMNMMHPSLSDSTEASATGIGRDSSCGEEERERRGWGS